METQVTNYQCPACTGPLSFSAETGKLGCAYCGSAFELAEIEAMYKEEDEEAAENLLEAEFDLSGLSEDWGEDKDKVRVYSCPSCTAELICDETTAATSCPYCGNPTVVPGQLTGTLKPDCLIPFRMDRQAAEAALKKHYQGRFFLPKRFKAESHLQEVQGVYVPFWLFDGQAQGSASYRATRSRSYVRGDYRITETSHYRIHREGRLSFEKVPVDAASKMPDSHMDSIEPYDYSDLQPFSTAYLPGFLADKYDISAEDSQPRAAARCEESLAQELRATVAGYDTVTDNGRNISIEKGTVRYALLPVWMLSTRWKDQNFLFAMNGQTGKLVGDLPVDRGKYWLTFGLLTLLLGAVTAVIALFAGSGNPLVWGIVVGLLLALIICSILKSGMKNVSAAWEAGSYIAAPLELTAKEDHFTHRTHSRVKISQKK